MPVQAQTPQAEPSQSQRSVVITIDDLPFVAIDDEELPAVQDWLKTFIAVLTENQIPAVGFVNESRLFLQSELNHERVALLNDWLDAGLELGNHTYSHVSLNQTSVEAFTDDVIQGEIITKTLTAEKGLPLRYFRHPFLHVGRDLKTRHAVQAFLSDHGYTIAPVTINNADWVFGHAYTKARIQADTEMMQRIGTAYLSHIEHSFEYAEKLSFDLFGSEISHVLVLHANSLNADFFEELLLLIKKRGYHFTSLEQVLGEKAYRSLDTYTGSGGDSWLYHWALSVGLRPEKEPLPPSFVRRLAGPTGFNKY